MAPSGASSHGSLSKQANSNTRSRSSSGANKAAAVSGQTAPKSPSSRPRTATLSHLKTRGFSSDDLAPADSVRIGLLESINIERHRRHVLEADFQAIKEEVDETRRRMPRKSVEDAERLAKELDDIAAKDKAERLVVEESERKIREEAERQLNEEAQRRAKEDAERKAEEEAQRRKNFEAEKIHRKERAIVGRSKMQNVKSLIVTTNKVKEVTQTASFRQRRADKGGLPPSPEQFRRTYSRRGALQTAAVSGGWYDAVARDWRKLATAPEALRRDRDVVLAASEASLGEALQYASIALRDDQELVMDAVNASMGRALSFASEDLRNNPEFVLKAMMKCATVLQYASTSLRSDRSFIQKAVRLRAVSLCFTTPDLRADRTLILEAVRSDGLALRYAAQELRSDHDFVVQATREAAVSTEAFSSSHSASTPALLSRSITLKRSLTGKAFSEALREC